MTRVLHIVPDSIGQARHRFLGSTKDVAGRTEYFVSRGVAYDVVVARDRSDGALLAELRRLDLSAYTAAILELPLYPRSIAYLRRERPDMRVLVRAINAEFLHQLHLARSNCRHWYARARQLQPLYDLWRGVSRLRLDASCGRRSHAVLGITDWESERYWSRIVGVDRAKTVPYFVPAAYVADMPGVRAKQDLCVCMLSTSYNLTPLPLDAAYNFGQALWRLGDKRPEWRFVLTGSTAIKTRFHKRMDTSIWMPPRVERLGFMETPLPLLAEARAVALLSDLGFGFKTKILESILCGCWVLVTPGLYARLPAAVQPFCIQVDLSDPRNLLLAIDTCREPPPQGDPNGVLRAQAFAALDELLLDGNGRAR